MVAQAADGAEALRMVEEAAPGVIVMDVIMPVMDGIEACREITELLPDTKSIDAHRIQREGCHRKVHRRRGHQVTFRRGTPARSSCSRPCGRWPRGSSAYLVTRPGRLSRAVRSGPGDGAPEPLDALTEREKEILKLFAQGLTYQEIGEKRKHQRVDRAERRVRPAEEAGIQDQAATGGLGGPHWAGGWWPAVVL